MYNIYYSPGEAGRGDLSPHFSRKELACRCCGQLHFDSRLLDGLERLRALAGVPVLVHAGYRCVKHNREVGGVPHSEHTLRRAADIDLPGVSLQHVYEYRSSRRGELGCTTAGFCTWTCASTGYGGRG